MTKEPLLVIDDELGPRESLRFLFKDQYDVTCVESVDRGVEEVTRAHPAAIIMDIRMPHKNGLQGLREIRAVDPQVSILMLTGFGSLETAQEAIRFGANDYVKKPFDAAELRRTVADHVARTHVLRKRMQAQAQLEALTAQLQTQLESQRDKAQLGEESVEFIHDLNGPLGVINGYVQLLLDELRDRSETSPALNQEYLAQIEQSVARCRDLMTLWRQRVKQTPTAPRAVRLADLIGEIVRTSRALALKRGATVLLTEGPAACAVAGNDIELFRAVQNLVRNALDAVPTPGGVVRLAWRSEGNQALIEVSDNGPGFPPEQLAPQTPRGLTTKAASGGMGLGLFITRHIIETHGGRLRLANDATDTGGARATIVLPLATASNPPPPRA